MASTTSKLYGRVDKGKNKLHTDPSKSFSHKNPAPETNPPSSLSQSQSQSDMGAAEEKNNEKNKDEAKNNSEDLEKKESLQSQSDMSIIEEQNKEKNKEVSETTNGDKEEMVDIPDLPLEDFEPEEEIKDQSVADESGGSIVFGIVGAGQAGGRLGESFYELGYRKCIAVNTSQHDLNGLKAIPEEQKVLMDAGAGGAGKDMARGHDAADKSRQVIYEKMQQVFGQVDRIIVCAGAGGGTGSGSCQVLVQVAKKYLTYLGVDNVDEKVGVLVTLPQAGETASSIVADNAHSVVTELCSLAEKKQISPLIIFDNDKIKRMYPKLTVGKFWQTVNATVTGLFHTFNVLSTKDGNPTSFDPADYGRVLSAGGCMIMGMTSVKKYDDGTDISKAIRENLEKTLLCGGFDISTAQAAACIATASANILNEVPGLMNSLETGFDTLANITGNAVVMRGIYEAQKEKLVVYTMLTGLSTPERRLKELQKFKNV